jgi:dephospho-CoA kinase
VLRVGLTGNIASGKSAVAEVWRGLGAAVVDADELARDAVAPGSPGLRAVVDAFGPHVLTSDGALDRAALRRIVFADAAARGRLEAIVHPEVARLRVEAEAVLGARGVDIVVHEIPLLYEVGAERGLDLVVLVDAPEDVRRERLVRQRALPAAEARAMIAAQVPAAEKRGRADLVIDNDGTPAELAAKAEEAWAQIRAWAERPGRPGRGGTPEEGSASG